MAWFDRKRLQDITDEIGLPNLRAAEIINQLAYNMTATDCLLIVKTVPVGGTIIHLVAANSVPAGTILNVMRFENSTTAITLDAAGADTINGGGTYAHIIAYGSFSVMSDGISKWTRVA